MKPRAALQERHLTEGRKREILRKWRSYRELVASPGGEGGHGYPDPEILPWCDQLNALPDVCTVQSCAGHNLAGGTRTSAHLWLRLSAPLAALFHQEAFDLAADTHHVEQLSTIYEPLDGEVVSIIFAGAERRLLDESMRRIVTFFERLSERLTSSG